MKANSIEYELIDSEKDLSGILHVLNVSHGTVVKEMGLTKADNPTNNAFIDEQTLKAQLVNGIDLYSASIDNKPIGCIAIEKSLNESDMFYIEKVSVIPDYRNQGIGVILMNFATEKIRELGGTYISIALIDSNTKLKNWYSSQGFKETGVKDFERLPFRVCFMKKSV